MFPAGITAAAPAAPRHRDGRPATPAELRDLKAAGKAQHLTHVKAWVVSRLDPTYAAAAQWFPGAGFEAAVFHRDKAHHWKYVTGGSAFDLPGHAKVGAELLRATATAATPKH